MKTLFLSLFLSVLVFAFIPNSGEQVQWETDFKQAVQKAKKSKKKLLINFTGSDWCGWCKKLDKEVFSQAAFIQYAEKNLVCVKVDFPKYKQIPQSEKVQNVELAKKYQVQGFPAIYLLDANENVLLKTGYQYGGAEKYVQHLEASIKK